MPVLLLGLAFVVDIAFSLYAGLVLQSLWGWFMVPVFDLPGLPFVTAAGIVIMATLLVMRPTLPDLNKSPRKILIEGFTAIGFKFVNASFLWLMALAILAAF